MRFRRYDTDLPSLVKEDAGNAGFDLCSRITITVDPNEVVRIPLNVATEIPFDTVGLLFQRSSTFRKWGIKLTNNVGVIDALYRGDSDEWAGDFRNETDKPVTVNYGDKICQAVFLTLSPVIPVEVTELGNNDRGGFGSTGSNVLK